MKKSNWVEDQRWVNEVAQPLVERCFYPQAFPNAITHALDVPGRQQLARLLDSGGVDRVVQHSNGAVDLIAERFRRAEYHTLNDFTIRLRRDSGSLTEYGKLMRQSGLRAGYYVHGFVNREETDFLVVRMLKIAALLELIECDQLPDPEIRRTEDGATFAAWHLPSLVLRWGTVLIQPPGYYDGMLAWDYD